MTNERTVHSDSPSAGDERAELPQTKAEVQARREELRSALVDLENTLTHPAGDEEGFGPQVQAAVERMRDTLQQHVRDTEAKDGMLAQLQEDAPWLEGRVEQLRREHDELLGRAEALVTHCRAAGDPGEVREEALDLLRQVSRHRHRGTDLLYDAYMVDISAGD